MAENVNKWTSSKRQLLDDILEADFCRTKVQYRSQKTSGKRERCRLKLSNVQQSGTKEEESEERDHHVSNEISETKPDDTEKENFTGRKDTETSTELRNGLSSAEQPETGHESEKMSIETSNKDGQAMGMLQATELLADQNIYVCELCGKDLTKFNSARRQQHANRCCDQSDCMKDRDQERKPEKVTCPLCSQLFRQERV